MTRATEVDTSRTLAPALARVVGHLLWRAAARVGAATDQAVPPDVDLHARAVLLALEPGDARSQQRLADTVSISRTTMTRTVAELVARGLVQRVRNPTDGRSYALSRTPAGAAAVGTWEPHSEAVEDVVAASLTAAERTELVGLLAAVARPWLPADTPDPLRGSLAFLVTRTHAHTHGRVLAALRHLGIEPRHLGSLIVVRASGPLSQADLARTLGISDPTVVEIVDHLEARGLVERRRLHHDRRTQGLHLLPAAGPVTAEAHQITDGCIATLLAPLDPAGRERLVDLLGRLVTGG